MHYDVIVIGAGLAGLTAATALQHEGRRVLVVDKARGVGGRMSMRRTGDLRFDHGAQYFTARDAQFAAAVSAWEAAGWVSPWQPRLAVIDANGVLPKSASPTRYVGVPGMNQICRHLAQGLEHRLQWQVHGVRPCGGGWALSGGESEELRARQVLLTPPPEQTLALLDGVPGLSSLDQLRGVRMRPCWALMAQFDQSPLAEYDAAFVNTGPISWMSSQRSRAERPGAHAWVIHASPEWSEIHLEREAEWVAATLLEAMTSLPGSQDSLQVQHAVAHRWRYAIAEEPLEVGGVVLAPGTMVAAGDWARGSRVEGAWLSGCAAARSLLSA